MCFTAFLSHVFLVLNAKSKQTRYLHGFLALLRKGTDIYSVLSNVLVKHIVSKQQRFLTSSFQS